MLTVSQNLLVIKIRSVLITGAVVLSINFTVRHSKGFRWMSAVQLSVARGAWWWTRHLTECGWLNESKGVIIELVLMYEIVANPVLRESLPNKKLGTLGMSSTTCSSIEKPFVFCWPFKIHVILPLIGITMLSKQVTVAKLDLCRTLMWGNNFLTKVLCIIVTVGAKIIARSLQLCDIVQTWQLESESGVAPW